MAASVVGGTGSSTFSAAAFLADRESSIRINSTLSAAASVNSAASLSSLNFSSAPAPPEPKPSLNTAVSLILVPPLVSVESTSFTKYRVNLLLRAALNPRAWSITLPAAPSKVLS